MNISLIFLKKLHCHDVIWYESEQVHASGINGLTHPKLLWTDNVTYDMFEDYGIPVKDEAMFYDCRRGWYCIARSMCCSWYQWQQVAFDLID